jgi:hypothetical protein
MKSRTVVLREERSPKGSRSLLARIGKSGDLRIEGQDLGSSVEEFWGVGLREYEWTITVRAAQLQQLIAALGGIDGDDVLSLLAARCSENERYASKDFLEERGVPVEFWSRVGE